MQYIHPVALDLAIDGQVKMMAGIHVIIDFLVRAGAVALVLDVPDKRSARAAFARAKSTIKSGIVFVFLGVAI